MGGDGSGRKPDPVKAILNQNKVGVQQLEPRTPIATEMFIPNHSGILGSQQAKNSLDARYLHTNTQLQPARALNTTYQNTTGATMFITGSVTLGMVDDGTTAYITGKSDASSPPTTIRFKAGELTSGFLVVANSVYGFSVAFMMVVLPNHYYRIDSTVSGFGSVTLDYWNEAYTPLTISP